MQADSNRGRGAPKAEPRPARYPHRRHAQGPGGTYSPPSLADGPRAELSLSVSGAFPPPTSIPLVCSPPPPQPLPRVPHARTQCQVAVLRLTPSSQSVLRLLKTGMDVKIGSVKPLAEKFNGRCTTVSEVDFRTPSTVSVNAGGFGAAGAEFGVASMPFPGSDHGLLGQSWGGGALRAGLVAGAGMGVSECEWVRCSCCSGGHSGHGLIHADL